MPSVFDGKYIKLNQKRGKNINILRKIPFALNTLLHAAKKEKKKCIKLIIIKAKSQSYFGCKYEHHYALLHLRVVDIPISEKVVGENGDWQLSNGECTTERNCGFLILMVNNQLSKLVNDAGSI